MKKDFSEALWTSEEIRAYSLDYVSRLQKTYRPGVNRVITPENVYQPAVLEGQELLEEFTRGLFLKGSQVEGLEHLSDCLERLKRGETILFMPEHRGNLDVPSFTSLLLREDVRFKDILDKLIYIAGRKLNESSDFIKMFTEKYSRLIIVPRRDMPAPQAIETPEEAETRAEFERGAGGINRSAFRQLVRLRKQGFIFVLYPLGGRWKADADNVPVKEATTYMKAFDTAYLISMEGNLLPPGEEMEGEFPVQQKVVFRVGPPLSTKDFLKEQKEIFKKAAGAKEISETDYELKAVEKIMSMLENLRLTGKY